MLTNKKRRVRCPDLFLTIFGICLLAGCTPPGPRAFLEGKQLIEQGKFALAAERLEVATSLLGTNALAWNYLGVAYHGAGQATNAALAYQRALALNRDLVEVRYNLGCLLLDQNRPDAAKSELTAYTLRQPNSPGGWLKLGIAQLRTRELGAAEKSFDSVLRLDAQNPEALNALGVVQLQKSRPREAAQYFNAALKQSPNYRPALLNLAVVSHQHLNARPLALQKYREYLESKPRPANWEAVNATAQALENQLSAAKSTSPTNPVAQVKVTTNVVTRTPDSLPRVAPTNSTKSELPINQPSAATATKLTPSNPKSATPPAKVEVVSVPDATVVRPVQDDFVAPPALAAPEPAAGTKSASPTATEPKAAKKGFFQRVNPVNLFRREPKPAPNVTPLDSPVDPSPTKPVEVAAVASKPEALPPAKATDALSSALPVFSQYVYRSPAKPTTGNRREAEVSFVQGVQAQRDHRPAAAVIAYRAAANADPSFFEAQYNLGLAAFDAGDLPQSLLAYELALAITPDSANARYNFALVLKEANYPVDAARELEKLLATHPAEVRAQLALANLYAQQLSQPPLARTHYLKVLALDPRHPQSTAIRYWLAANPK